MKEIEWNGVSAMKLDEINGNEIERSSCSSSDLRWYWKKIFKAVLVMITSELLWIDSKKTTQLEDFGPCK